MKASLGIILGLGFIQAGLCSGLSGSSSYAVIGPGQESNVHLVCKVEEDDSLEQTMFSWLNPNKLVVAFTATQSNYEASGFNSSWLSESQEMDLEITSVKLSDDGDFTCQFSQRQATVNLFVNQYPTMDVQVEKSVVLENELSTVAKCSAGLSKPPPKIWFEDTMGKKIKSESSINHVAVGNGLTNSTLSLEKRFSRSDNSMMYFCKIKHVNQTVASLLPVGKLNVKYSPVVEFTDKEIEDELQAHAEGRMLEIGCAVQGFPTPKVTWTFEPDVQFETTDDENESVKQTRPTLPSNFMVLEGGLKLFTPVLKVTDDFETNNGTFTCFASNELGTASKSFALQVYELPVTTQAPTTAAMPAEESEDGADIATNVLPVKAGADAAVIGGVVAVAAFVLIITVILLLRYFLSHKGEYYTHELKTNNDDTGTDLSDNDEDDDGLPRTEADLLGENKRTEHFL